MLLQQGCAKEQQVEAGQQEAQPKMLMWGFFDEYQHWHLLEEVENDVPLQHVKVGPAVMKLGIGLGFPAPQTPGSQC